MMLWLTTLVVSWLLPLVPSEVWPPQQLFGPRLRLVLLGVCVVLLRGLGSPPRLVLPLRLPFLYGVSLQRVVLFPLLIIFASPQPPVAPFGLQQAA